MDTELQYIRFLGLVLCFLGSIFLLIFSSDLLMLFVGWDLLGFTRFFLVSYYSNLRSHSAALLTALTNRLGDCLFFVFFGIRLSSAQSYSAFCVFLLF